MSRLQAYTAADLARMRSVAVRPQGWSYRVKARRKTIRHLITGELMQITLDELGNRIRERQHGQDAHVFLPHLVIHAASGEVMKELRG